MALKKKIAKDTGVDIEYWRVAQFRHNKQIDGMAAGVEVTMFGYLTKQARDDGKEPADSAGFFFSGVDYDALLGAASTTGATIEERMEELYAQFYLKIKTLPDWSDAIDV